MPRRFLVARLLISVAREPGLSVTSLRPHSYPVQLLPSKVLGETFLLHAERDPGPVFSHTAWS